MTETNETIDAADVGVAFPLEVEQDASNSLTIRDAGGDILFQFMDPHRATFTKLAERRTLWLADVLNTHGPKHKAVVDNDGD